MIIQTKITKEDALELLELGYQMHQEAPNFRQLPYKRERIWKILDQSLLNPSRVCALVAKEDDKIIGFFIGSITEQFFSGDLLANDIAMFVLPEYRGGSCFPRLLKAFENWAHTNNAERIILAHSSGINTEKSNGFFVKQGYPLTGYIFTKEL